MRRNAPKLQEDPIALSPPSLWLATAFTLVSSLLFAASSPAQVAVEDARERPAVILALDDSGTVALIDAGGAQDVAANDAVAILAEGHDVAHGTVAEVYTDAAKVRFPPEAGVLAEGMKVTVVHTPAKGFDRLKRAWQENISGSIETGFSYYGLDGNTLKSFRERGFSYLNDTQLTYKDELDENLNVQVDTHFRATDDIYLEPENFAGKRLRLAVTEKENRYGIVVGDEYTFLSHYTMSQTLKGVKAYGSWDTGLGSTKLTGIFGTTRHRWEDFYTTMTNELFTRYVTGARAEQRYKDVFTAGFNFVDSRDDTGSDGPGSGAGVHNDIFSLDARAKLWDRLNVAGEVAYAFTDTDADRQAKKTKTDKAWRIDSDLLLTDQENFRNHLFYSFERAGQNFTALSGILKTNRQEHILRHRLDLGPYVSVRYQFNRFWDNLKDVATDTTKTHENDLDVILRPLPAHPASELRLEAFLRDNESTDPGTTRNDTKSIYLQARSRVGKLNFWSGVRFSRKGDDITPSNRRRTKSLDGGVDGHWTVFGLRVSPRLSFELERDKEPTAPTRSTLVRVRTGCTVASRASELRFSWNLRDDDNRILSDNTERNTFEIEARHYLAGDPSRVVSVWFRRDDFDNNNAARDWEENLLAVRFIQYV